MGRTLFPNPRPTSNSHTLFDWKRGYGRNSPTLKFMLQFGCRSASKGSDSGFELPTRWYTLLQPSHHVRNAVI